MLHDLLMIFIGVIAVVVISMVISILKSKNKNKYIGSSIISFLFPIIGLIIYAVNIGKNDELAKKCAKYALISIVIGFIILLFIFLI